MEREDRHRPNQRIDDYEYNQDLSVEDYDYANAVDYDTFSERYSSQEEHDSGEDEMSSLEELDDQDSDGIISSSAWIAREDSSDSLIDTQDFSNDNRRERELAPSLEQAPRESTLTFAERVESVLRDYFIAEDWDLRLLELFLSGLIRIFWFNIKTQYYELSWTLEFSIEAARILERFLALLDDVWRAAED